MTTGRQAFVAALKADGTLSSTVNTWYEWAGGLKKRFAIEAVDCPFCAVSPAEGDVARNANVIRDVPQVLLVELGDDGEDVATVEEMLAAVIEVVNTASQTRLGLADSEGLANVQIAGMRWMTFPDRRAGRTIWQVSVMVRLVYKR